MHRTKLPPPLILDAPPDLAALVERFARVKDGGDSREYLAAWYGIARWFKQARAWRVLYVTGGLGVRCYNGDVHVGVWPVPVKPLATRPFPPASSPGAD